MSANHRRPRQRGVVQLDEDLLRPFAGPEQVLAYLSATPIGSRSPTAGSLPQTRASPSGTGSNRQSKPITGAASRAAKRLGIPIVS
jgi:hypothetical protein